MNEQIFSLILAVLTLVVTIATGYVVRFLKRKGWYTTVETLVQAAEQMYKATDPDGSIRKNYVKGFAEKLGIKLSESELNALIEAAVLGVNNAQQPAVLKIKPPEFPDSKLENFD